MYPSLSFGNRILANGKGRREEGAVDWEGGVRRGTREEEDVERKVRGNILSLPVGGKKVNHFSSSLNSSCEEDLSLENRRREFPITSCKREQKKRDKSPYR